MMRNIIITLLVLCALTNCSSQVQQTPVGTTQRDTICGVPCCVYVPYNYSRRTNEAPFPVLYLQHGMYGSEDDWTTQGQLVEIMDSLLHLQQVKEMVVIMPDNFLGSVPPEARPVRWQDLTDEQEKRYEMSGYWESHFSSFMQEAEQRYHISRQPAHRAIAGLSMGGFHTMHISHYLHGQFQYIGLFSAVILPPFSAEPYDHWEEEVIQMAAENTIYWIGIGREDFLYKQLQDYRQWLDSNHIEYTYYESPGGHTWENWQDYIARFLKKIN